MTQATQTLPANYKQTGIGVIPVDWDVKDLGSLFEITSSKRVFQSEWRDSGVPFYRARELAVLGEKGKVENDLFIEKEMFDKYKKMYGAPQKGDLLVTGVGTLGKTYVVSGNHEFYFKDGNIIWFKIEDKVDSYFLKQLYLTPLIERQISEKSAGSTVGTYTITGAKKTIIPLPKKPEQTAIAIALSDTDALIEKLEKLIAKKRAIKQGVMQQLLTGKKRLPGFSGEWVRKKIGDIGEITGSGVDKKTSPDELPVRLVNFLNVYHQSFIYSKDLNHLVTARPEQITRCSVKKGDVFFTPSSEMPYDVGLSAIAMEDIPDVVYSYHVDRMRLFEDWDLLFRAYIFQTKDFSDQAATQCEGSGKRYVLNLTTFRERLTVYYPTYKKEQTAIATVLSDMDTEIEKLEKKLNKYRQVKTGMMQQLLTGKIRLIDK